MAVIAFHESRMLSKISVDIGKPELESILIEKLQSQGYLDIEEACAHLETRYGCGVRELVYGLEEKIRHTGLPVEALFMLALSYFNDEGFDVMIDLEDPAEHPVEGEKNRMVFCKSVVVHFAQDFRLRFLMLDKPVFFDPRPVLHNLDKEIGDFPQRYPGQFPEGFRRFRC
jgi:hypothetical protein